MRTATSILTCAVTLLDTAPGVTAQDVPCPSATTPALTYRCIPIPNQFSSIANLPGALRLVFAETDDAEVPVNFPPAFAFAFYGAARAGLRVYTNGFIYFGAIIPRTWRNHHPDDPASPDEAIFAWFDDLDVWQASVFARFDMTPRAETLTIEWSRVRLYPGDWPVPAFSFQVILCATTHATLPDHIEFRYDRTTQPSLQPCNQAENKAASATVGCQPLTADPGVAVGTDATERGGGTATFPACDIRLAPRYARQPIHQAQTTVVRQEQFCTIRGLAGTTVVPNPCRDATPCMDELDSATGQGFAIPLPWKFNLDGRATATANMNSNGVLTLAPGRFLGTNVNVVLPSPAFPNACLAPFWDDLKGIGLASGMYYRVDGTPGCRVMTFEWSDMDAKVGSLGACTGAGGRISFQVKLYEGSAGSIIPGGCPNNLINPGRGSDRIEFHYDHANFVPAPPPGFSGTIGYDDHTGSIGASIAPSPNVTAPPRDAAGAPAKVVIDACDSGLIRYYGDRNNTAPPGAPFGCLPELKGNGIPPIIGNDFGLQVVGASPASPCLLVLDLGGAIPGLSTPVPCSGVASPFGTLWVNLFHPVVTLVSATSSGARCEGSADFALPLPQDPTIVGATVFVQGIVVYPAPVAPFIAFDLTEGAMFMIGG